ncbi:MAG: DUF2695 domain-containing protein [Sporichthyaceae bacterium]|jgi:hypothetical protein
MTFESLPSLGPIALEVDGGSTVPRDRECLPCYLGRMLAEFGCNNRLRWALVWRDHAAPNATALHRSLQSRGGYCDCEVLFNVYPDALPEDADAAAVPCRGVSRRGSTLPCRPD